MKITRCVPDRTCSGVCFSRLWGLRRPKLNLHFRKPSESRGSRSRFRTRNARKQLTQKETGSGTKKSTGNSPSWKQTFERAAVVTSPDRGGLGQTILKPISLLNYSIASLLVCLLQPAKLPLFTQPPA